VEAIVLEFLSCLAFSSMFHFVFLDFSLTATFPKKKEIVSDSNQNDLIRFFSLLKMPI